MEGKSNQFLFSFIFDVFFFSVCVCIWLYIRKNRDENKINDNIYILSQSTDSDAKSGRDSGVKTTEIGKAKKKSATFRTFLNIKDDKIVNTEIKFYLFFLKTNRNIVFSLCVLGTFLVLPVYLYLPRNDLSNPSLLNYISAGSISDTNVMAILFFITLIYSAIAYAFIYLLWKRVKPNKEKAKSFLPQNFTIMVSNIDRDDVNAYNIYKYFCNLTNNKVVSVFLILDYSVLFGLQKKILNATNKLNMLKENEEKKKNKKGKESSHNIFQIFWKEKKKKKKGFDNDQEC